MRGNYNETSKKKKKKKKLNKKKEKELLVGLEKLISNQMDAKNNELKNDIELNFTDKNNLISHDDDKNNLISLDDDENDLISRDDDEIENGIIKCHECMNIRIIKPFDKRKLSTTISTIH